MKIVKINQKPQDPFYTPVRSLMDEFFSYPLIDRSIEEFSADIWEEDNNIFVKMAMPGIKKEDIKISVTGDILTIEGENKETHEEKDSKKYFLKSFQSCSYSQRFNLPSLINPDQVKAKFEDGVLTVELPKAKESQTKQIEIS